MMVWKRLIPNIINNDNKIEFLGIGFLRNNSKTKKNKNRLIKAFENTWETKKISLEYFKNNFGAKI